jgi:3-hydroxyacyl-CoA dehydrogenase/enoyl-CoA hydratase/3-hydroxybutyryl-CoA epimerase
VDERANVSGVVLVSAKKTFCVGADLRELRNVVPGETAETAEFLRAVKAALRRLEMVGRPVVAALSGAALGGGLEIALACHHRLVLDDPSIQIGLPEVSLGLLPGAGGVVRTVRMLGLRDALANVLLEGTRYSPADAKAIGIVDELVARREDLFPAARAWIVAHPDAAQPWDREGYEMPGGKPAGTDLDPYLEGLSARLRQQVKGHDYPAPHHILAAAVEGAHADDFEIASEIEGRHFLDLVTSQTAKNMIQTFFDSQAVRGSRGQPRAREVSAARRAVVLGAGMMGSGIAYVCAQAGIDVVLKDVDLESARRGKTHCERVVEQTVARGRATRADASALLARITPTANAADAAGADLVIEAVFEDPDLKRRTYAEIEPHIAKDALLASNTSTLPISDLAAAVTTPAQFVGLHFFSPVDRMTLLEIVKGKQTSSDTIQRSLDLARQLGKTPIVVNDSHGFFTTRVIVRFLDEGAGMLQEGVPAASVEQASSEAGYPAPVLALCDELSLTLLRSLRQHADTAAELAGRAPRARPADIVIDRMIDEFDRAGRRAGAGFYEYIDGKRSNLWTGLKEAFGDEHVDIPLADLKDRMLFIEALEAMKCLDEGVIESVAEANVGSILGIGFPSWTGGVLQYINGYPGGPQGFVARASDLSERYGARFAPPDSLVDKADRGLTWTDGPMLAGA